MVNSTFSAVDTRNDTLNWSLKRKLGVYQKGMNTKRQIVICLVGGGRKEGASFVTLSFNLNTSSETVDMISM